MEKRYQVFVSSTFTDLKDERSKVIQTIMELDCIPAGMEIFPAIDEEQFNFIKRVIDDCDYYLLIIGGRYGSVSEKGVSYTEMEYDYAIEKELKVIAFIHSSPESIPLGKSEIDEIARQKLQMFKEKVAEGRLIKHWKDALDLPGLVLSSLSQTIKRYPATGWVRANELRSPMLTEEFAVLTRENRELKAELEKYNQKNLSRPKIEVFANDSREIQLSIEKTRNWDLCLHVDEKDIPHNILIQLPENYVNLYNESVDDNIEIAQEYNENCKLYNAKKKEIVFSVHNIGSAKANILYIDIEVPEDLKIISQDEAEQISLNWPQKILMHPVNKAFEKPIKHSKIRYLIVLGLLQIDLGPFQFQEYVH